MSTVIIADAPAGEAQSEATPAPEAIEAAAEAAVETAQIHAEADVERAEIAAATEVAVQEQITERAAIEAEARIEEASSWRTELEPLQATVAGLAEAVSSIQTTLAERLPPNPPAPPENNEATRANPEVLNEAPPVPEPPRKQKSHRWI